MVSSLLNLLTKFGNVSSNVGMKQTLLKWPTVSVRQVTHFRGKTVLNLAKCRRGWPEINSSDWNLKRMCFSKMIWQQVGNTPKLAKTVKTHFYINLIITQVHFIIHKGTLDKSCLCHNSTYILLRITNADGYDINF